MIYLNPAVVIYLYPTVEVYLNPAVVIYIYSTQQ